MSKKYLAIIKWVAPIVIITLALIQQTSIAFPTWLSILLLITTTILYTISLFIERKNNHIK